MEGDPDVKRPRLEYEQSGHPALRHPHHSAALPAPPQFPHPPQPHGHPLGPSPQPYREGPPDSRGLSFQPPPPAHQGPPDHRPSYGSINHHSSRSFSSSETGTPRPPPPITTGDHKGGPPPPGPEQHPHMEHAVHGAVYPIDPHGNVGLPPGALPYHVSPGEQYPPSGHPSYPSTPIAAYAPTHQFAPSAAQYGAARRKQVRAQQACNNCRQRKQKCDEARPCAYCKQEGLECEYKEVPPPKTDRTMQEINRKIDDLHQQMDDIHDMRQSNASLKSDFSQMQSKIDQVLQVVMNLQQHEQQAARSARSPTVKADLSQAAVPLSAGSTKSATLDHEAQVTEAELGSHRTGAHHLRLTWDHIQGFYDRAQVFSDGISDPEYVQHEEEKQQKDLQLYSWLVPNEEGSSEREYTGIRSPPQSVQDAPSANSPPDYAHPTRFTSAPNLPEGGGWNVDGTLKLDSSTVKKYFNSYMRHMWVMHPFIDAVGLKEQVDRFIGTYSQGATRMSSWNHSGMTSGEVYGNSLKRKRQPGFPDSHSSPSSPGLNHAQPVRRPETFERTIENAIVLLVLALGCILEQDGFLLHELESPYTLRSANTSFSSQNYPSNFVKPSPPQYYNNIPYSGAPSPAQDFARTTSAYQTNYSNSPSHNDRGERPRKYRWKAERIPGVAYFSAATDILGNQMTTNDIPHAQAFLLAGLFYGQIGRILDSWQWIFRGCNAIHAMGMSSMFGEITKLTPQEATGDHVQIFLFLFWSALQLDSDIRAELDSLHADSMSKYAAVITYPNRMIGPDANFMIPLYGERFDVSKVGHYFASQLYLRRQLNHVHASLYKNEPANRAAAGQPMTWGSSRPSELWAAMKGWMMFLPEQLKWDEASPPASDINSARLRGKLYGTSYVITRPFLRWAVYYMDPRPLEPEAINDEWYEVTDSDSDWERLKTLPPDRHLSSANPDKETIEENVLWACRRCIYAAMKSTVAFDGLGPGGSLRRPRVTNIHGTATAQFGNMLVLASAYMSWLHPYIHSERFFWLLNRTIKLLANLTPLSRVFALHHRVLETVMDECRLEESRRAQGIAPQTGTGAMHPPNNRLDRFNSAPASGVDSVNSSFSNEMS